MKRLHVTSRRGWDLEGGSLAGDGSQGVTGDTAGLWFYSEELGLDSLSNRKLVEVSKQGNTMARLQL